MRPPLPWGRAHYPDFFELSSLYLAESGEGKDPKEECRSFILLFFCKGKRETWEDASCRACPLIKPETTETTSTSFTNWNVLQTANRGLNYYDLTSAAWLWLNTTTTNRRRSRREMDHSCRGAAGRTTRRTSQVLQVPTRPGNLLKGRDKSAPLLKTPPSPAAKTDRDNVGGRSGSSLQGDSHEEFTLHLL